jgi:AraC family transcriptional regulator
VRIADKSPSLPNLSLPTGSGVAIYPPGAEFGPREMRDYEFVWLIEGDAEYTWGGEKVAAPEGSIVLCRPGAVDAFRWDPLKPTCHGYYHFQIHALPRDWPKSERWPLVRMPEEGDTLRPLFRHLLTWWGRGNELLCRLTMAHMLTAFVCGETETGGVPAESRHEAVERALAYVDAKLDEDPGVRIALPELAHAAFVTPEHLCRLFKAHTGHSPVETLRLARLDRAMMLLARSNYAVQEIARQCGYANAFHFSRQFKQVYGKSPRKMRGEIRDGAIVPLSRLVRLLRPAKKRAKVARMEYLPRPD